MLLIFKVKCFVYTTIMFKGRWLSLVLVSFTIFSTTLSCFSCSHVGVREYTYKTMKNVSRFWRWALLFIFKLRVLSLQPQFFYRSIFQLIQTVSMTCNFFLHIFRAQVFLLHPQGQTSDVGSDDLIHITAASYFLILMNAFWPVDVHPDCCKNHYSNALL